MGQKAFAKSFFQGFLKSVDFVLIYYV